MKATIFLGDDTCRFDLPDGRTLDLSGQSPDDIIEELRMWGVTRVEATEEGGATGLYGDLAPGVHTLAESKHTLG